MSDNKDSESEETKIDRNSQRTDESHNKNPSLDKDSKHISGQHLFLYIYLIISITLFGIIFYTSWETISGLSGAPPTEVVPIEISQVIIGSAQFTALDPTVQLLIKEYTLNQYAGSAAFIFLGLLFSYMVHIMFMIQNIYETYVKFKKYAGLREMGSHAWYLLIITIVFPLALSVIPEFSSGVTQFRVELLSRITLATLFNLIVVLLTAELSALYFSLDQDTLIPNVKDLIEKVFKDSRLKHLLVAIVLDVITFYFLSRLPSRQGQLNFTEPVIILLCFVTIYSLLSSYGSIFTLAVNDKIRKVEVYEKGIPPSSNSDDKTAHN